MNRICGRWVDVVSRTLDPAEREAVLGDLAESGVSGHRALREVLGLVVRRQAALWNEWRPWLALAGLVIPFAILLSLFARRTADGSAIYIWLYANNGDWSILANPAFRDDFAGFAAGILWSYLTLMFCSMIGGLVLGILPRRTIPVNGVLFCLTLFVVQLLEARSSPDRGPVNAEVFEPAFYRVIFPLLVQLILVVPPSLWGMRRLGFLALAGIAAAADQPAVRAILQPANQRKPASEFALQDGFGKTVSLNSYRGQVVLLDFWATWCGGCIREMPWFAEFHRKYAAKGLVVLGVSMDDDGWKVVKPFLERTKVPYRILLGDDPTAKKYRIASMPDTFLIDRHGRIAATYAGLVDKDDVERNIRAMLSEP